jgi:hypothetical protein
MGTDAAVLLGAAWWCPVPGVRVAQNPAAREQRPPTRFMPSSGAIASWVSGADSRWAKPHLPWRFGRAGRVGAAPRKQPAVVPHACSWRRCGGGWGEGGGG